MTTMEVMPQGVLPRRRRRKRRVRRIMSHLPVL